jgi:hypothetical protein
VRGPASALRSASERVSGATLEAGAALARLGTLARRS